MPQQIGYEVGIRDSHGCKAIVLRLARIDLFSVLVNGGFGPFQFGTANDVNSQTQFQ
jgi:hypothetical protein